MSAMGTFVQTRFLHGIPFFVRFLTVALLGGGLIGGIANFLLQKSLWVWVMPDLAHRFLAAAAFGYVVGSVVALTRTRWAESELLLVTVVLYGVPLIAAILLQADVIDWGRPVAWAFVAIVSQAMVISLVYLWRNHDRAEREEAHPLSATLRVYLVAVGLLALVVGVIVYVAPKQSGFLWPWAELRAWKPLDGRLIASMLVTLGGGALLVAWRDDRGAAQVFFAMLGAYCLVAAVALALHTSQTPAFAVTNTVYIVIFAAIFFVGVGLLAWERRDAPAPLWPTGRMG